MLVLLFIYNYARFDKFTMFGHEYLNIAWKERVERWGLFNYHFLSRNLAASLVLLPKIFVSYPFVQYSRHGHVDVRHLAQPGLAVRPPRAQPAGPGAVDHHPGARRCRRCCTRTPATSSSATASCSTTCLYLIMLLAVGGQRFGLLFKILLVLSAGVNLFGAITFDRYPQFSYEDNCIFPHGCN